MATIFYIQSVLLRCCQKGMKKKEGELTGESQLREEAREVLELAERREENPFVFMTDLDDFMAGARAQNGVVAFRVDDEYLKAVLKNTEHMPEDEERVRAEDVFFHKVLFQGYVSERGCSYKYEAPEEADGAGIGYVEVVRSRGGKAASKSKSRAKKPRSKSRSKSRSRRQHAAPSAPTGAAPSAPVAPAAPAGGTSAAPSAPVERDDESHELRRRQDREDRRRHRKSGGDRSRSSSPRKSRGRHKDRPKSEGLDGGGDSHSPRRRHHHHHRGRDRDRDRGRKGRPQSEGLGGGGPEHTRE